MSARVARVALLLAAVFAGAAASAKPADPLVGQLTQLAEFAAGRPFDEGARTRFEALAAAELGRKPAERPGVERTVGDAVARIRDLRDDARRAAPRTEIVSRLYWSAREREDPVSDMILGHAGVVAADRETGAVVRRADLEAVCRSAKLGADALGEDFDSESCRSDLLADAAKLSSIEPDGRRIIASGERRAAALDMLWRNLAPERRRELAEIARSRAGPGGPFAVARSLETIALAARLDATLARFGSAAAGGLPKGAAASAIGRAAGGF